MSADAGLKAIQQDSADAVPHVLGFQTPRTTPDDLLLDVWNGPTSADRRFAIDLDGKLYSAALSAGGLLVAADGAVAGVKRLDTLAIGSALQVLRVKADGSGLEYHTLTYADVGADAAGAAAAVTLAGLGGVSAADLAAMVPTIHGGSGTASVSGTLYYAPWLSGVGYATESYVVSPVPRAGTIAKLTVANVIALDGSHSLTLTMRRNSADTALTVTIPSGSAAGFEVSDTSHSFTVAAGDLIDLKLVMTGTATTITFLWSMTFSS